MNPLAVLTVALRAFHEPLRRGGTSRSIAVPLPATREAMKLVLELSALLLALLSSSGQEEVKDDRSVSEDLRGLPMPMPAPRPAEEGGTGDPGGEKAAPPAAASSLRSAGKGVDRELPPWLLMLLPIPAAPAPAPVLASVPSSSVYVRLEVVWGILELWKPTR
jgi:hypothetical protein